MSPRYITRNLDPFLESLVSHTKATPVSIQVATNDSGLILTLWSLSRLWLHPPVHIYFLPASFPGYLKEASLQLAPINAHACDVTWWQVITATVEVSMVHNGRTKVFVTSPPELEFIIIETVHNGNLDSVIRISTAFPEFSMLNSPVLLHYIRSVMCSMRCPSYNSMYNAENRESVTVFPVTHHTTFTFSNFKSAVWSWPNAGLLMWLGT